MISWNVPPFYFFLKTANALVYVNHRPYLDLSKQDLLNALAKVSKETNQSLVDSSQISRSKLYSLLQEYGETMHVRELDDALETLLNDHKSPYRSTGLPSAFSVKDFVKEILSLLE